MKSKLYFDRIDVSEGIDINKTSAFKECDIFPYFYFLDKEFKFQTYVCNRCHDFLMMSTNLRNIAILNINGADYNCIISRISKSEAINLMETIDLTENVEYYMKKKLLLNEQKWKIINQIRDKNFVSIYKNG